LPSLITSNAFKRYDDDSRKYNREVAAQQQTPVELKRKQLATRFTEQVDAYGLDQDLPPELASMFQMEPDDVRRTEYSPRYGKDVAKSTTNIHHITPLRNLDGIFANCSAEEEAILNSITQSGDYIKNAMIVPQIAHQGVAGLIKPVHTRMREAGLEIQPGKLDQSNLNPVLAEIEKSYNAPFSKKVELAKRYRDEVKPLIQNELDDSLMEYEELVSNVLADAKEGADYRSRAIRDAQIVNNMTDAQKRKELQMQESNNTVKNVENFGNLMDTLSGV
jgi:hypothetical protein